MNHSVMNPTTALDPHTIDPDVSYGTCRWLHVSERRPTEADLPIIRIRREDGMIVALNALRSEDFDWWLNLKLPRLPVTGTFRTGTNA